MSRLSSLRQDCRPRTARARGAVVSEAGTGFHMLAGLALGGLQDNSVLDRVVALQRAIKKLTAMSVRKKVLDRFREATALRVDACRQPPL
jgi:hypothetical protein